MKKIFGVLFIFIVLFLTSCTTPEEILVKNMLNVDGEYHLTLDNTIENINLKEYIESNTYYSVSYLGNKYDSNDELKFKLEDGLNVFTINTSTQSIVLNFYKEYYLKVTLLDSETKEVKNEIYIKPKESLNSVKDVLVQYVKEHNSWNGEISYSNDNVNFKEANIDNFIVEENIYIMLKTKPILYEVSFENDGVVETKKFAIGDVINLNTVSKEGYSFLGWYANDKLILENTTYNLELGNQFIAKFSPNKYSIKYINIDEERTQEVTYGEEFKLFIPDKEGFLYWSYNDNKFENGLWSYLEDITLEAVWEEPVIEPIVNLNLETFGGIVENNAKIDLNGYIILPAPHKEGYNFKYWCKDSFLTEKIENILASEYNNEKLYACYEYDSNNLKSEVVFTMYNKHVSTYDQITMFDSSKSGFTSKYWHKIGIVNNNGNYYVSKIVPNGTSISELGSYDYVLLAYSGYSGYSSFINIDCQVGYRVNFLIDPQTMEEGSVTNIASFYQNDLTEEKEEITLYLSNIYGNITSVNEDIELINEYNYHNITWKTSNRNAITTEGKYIKPYVTRNVTLTAVIDGEEIYSFDVLVEGEKDESTALSTGYIYTPYNTITQNAMNTLDIIYCAFLDVDAEANWTNLSRMTSNINNYIKPKAAVSGTKIVISVNQNASGNFSSIAASPELREKLATNILAFIQTMEIDGIDIDWETPSSSEAENFTLLMKAIYEKVKTANPEYIVTAAIGGGKWAPPKYDLPNSKNYMDYINLMTYSMATGNGYYQNSLYKSTIGRTLTSCSIEESIKIYNDLGVENSQILVGIPFYVTAQTDSGGPGSKTGDGKSKWYNLMFTTYQLSDTMKEYYDEECGVPYRYDEVNKIFISFDNERSIKEKCDYINTLGLAGIMYWQYGQDVEDMLSDAINKYINE